VESLEALRRLHPLLDEAVIGNDSEAIAATPASSVVAAGLF
jgi:hypothetical protein